MSLHPFLPPRFLAFAFAFLSHSQLRERLGQITFARRSSSERHTSFWITTSTPSDQTLV
ncbi:hypothetical protein SAMD00023353_4200200 [Rosellinia necatrix]|uniref:Uncharacterized protein n=1 Tax=Rosellinia necatrix TaxID=77044 RepID=A0A1S8A9N4_ROSNE|nr:hypothetical protein SAMD00023353_4200200 [Rosellinia necatrix]